MKNENYKNYNKNTLESLLGYGSYGRNLKKSSYEPSPLFTAEYARMIRLAEEQDDFGKVAEVFLSVAQMSPLLASVEAERELQRAHAVYVTAQKRLAKVFGDQGQLDLTRQHLSNATSTMTLDLGYNGKITLQPEIEEGYAHSIMDNALRNTPLGPLLQRVVNFSQEGDVEKTTEYVYLSLRAFGLRGLLEAPTGETLRNGASSRNRKYDVFFTLQRGLHTLHQRAYGVAARKKMEEALGYAVQDTRGSDPSPARKIEKLRVEAQDILLAAVRETVPSNLISGAFDTVFTFINTVLDPASDELIACSTDRDHPLRTLFRAKVKKEGLQETVEGVVATPITTTALVPRQFYEEQFRRNGIPLRIHSFFIPRAL